jgi:hypothetical protein
MSLVTSTASGYERWEVGPYRFIVGFRVEPASVARVRRPDAFGARTTCAVTMVPAGVGSNTAMAPTRQPTCCSGGSTWVLSLSSPSLSEWTWQPEDMPGTHEEPMGSSPPYVRSVHVYVLAWAGSQSCAQS